MEAEDSQQQKLKVWIDSISLDYYWLIHITLSEGIGSLDCTLTVDWGVTIGQHLACQIDCIIII